MKVSNIIGKLCVATTRELKLPYSKYIYTYDLYLDYGTKPARLARIYNSNLDLIVPTVMIREGTRRDETNTTYIDMQPSPS